MADEDGLTERQKRLSLACTLAQEYLALGLPPPEATRKLASALAVCNAAAQSCALHPTDKPPPCSGQALEFLRRHSLQSRRPASPMLRHLAVRTQTPQVCTSGTQLPNNISTEVTHTMQGYAQQQPPEHAAYRDSGAYSQEQQEEPASTSQPEHGSPPSGSGHHLRRAVSELRQALAAKDLDAINAAAAQIAAISQKHLAKQRRQSAAGQVRGARSGCCSECCALAHCLWLLGFAAERALPGCNASHVQEGFLQSERLSPVHRPPWSATAQPPSGRQPGSQGKLLARRPEAGTAITRPGGQGRRLALTPRPGAGRPPQERLCRRQTGTWTSPPATRSATGEHAVGSCRQATALLGGHGLWPHPVY